MKQQGIKECKCPCHEDKGWDCPYCKDKCSPLQEPRGYFDLTDKEIITSSEETTSIVPVNITYFPMRARIMRHSLKSRKLHHFAR